MSNYSIRLHTIPRRNGEPLTSAIVYQGSTPIAQTAAYSRNAGSGIAAAIRDAQCILDARRVEEWFRTSLPETSKVELPPTVVSVEGTEMVKDYLSQYVTMIVAGGAVLALIMKGCM